MITAGNCALAPKHTGGQGSCVVVGYEMGAMRFIQIEEIIDVGGSLLDALAVHLADLTKILIREHGRLVLGHDCSPCEIGCAAGCEDVCDAT